MSSDARREAGTARPVAPCRVCGHDAGEVLVEFPRVPINCSALHASATEAVDAPSGSLRLVLCPACGYVCNQDFDPAALTYDAAYENALDFSPSFRAYQDELASGLVRRHDLRGRSVVEIGCGQGGFLSALVAEGVERAFGFDPSFRHDLDLPAAVEISSEMFDPAVASVRADLYCARHVLEHLPEPLEFLRGLRPAVAEGNATLYLEVPAAEAVFGGDATFDLIYPHVSYFSAPALVGLLGRAGFAVERVDRAFGGQYVAVEARAARRAVPPVPAGDIAQFVDAARGAAAELDRRLAAARRVYDDARGRGRATAVWGAGAKAVTFLALLERRVDAVVDINPRKHGSFVSGAGIAIGAPETLSVSRPEAVFVLNPMYRDEIAGMLAAESIQAEVVVV